MLPCKEMFCHVAIAHKIAKYPRTYRKDEERGAPVLAASISGEIEGLGSSREQGLFLTKWGNQFQRRQPRYVSRESNARPKRDLMSRTHERYIVLAETEVNVHMSTVRLDEQVNLSFHFYKYLIDLISELITLIRSNSANS